MTTNTNGENEADLKILGPANPWLSQGDVFEHAPTIHVTLLREQLSPEILYGPAMLVTHDCALDKRVGSPPRAKVPRLHLARLLSTMSLPKDKQKELRARRDRIDPSEVMYLGWLPELGECFVDLSDLCAIPAEYFGVELSSVELSDTDDLRLHTAKKHARIGSMSEQSRQLLSSKLMKYWTRLRPTTSQVL